jgi:hypothetical protein
MPGRNFQLRRCVSLAFCPSAWNMTLAAEGAFLKFCMGDFLFKKAA